MYVIQLLIFRYANFLGAFMRMNIYILTSINVVCNIRAQSILASTVSRNSLILMRALPHLLIFLWIP